MYGLARPLRPQVVYSVLPYGSHLLLSLASPPASDIRCPTATRHLDLLSLQPSYARYYTTPRQSARYVKSTKSVVSPVGSVDDGARFQLGRLRALLSSRFPVAGGAALSAQQAFQLVSTCLPVLRELADLSPFWTAEEALRAAPSLAAIATHVFNHPLMAMLSPSSDDGSLMELRSTMALLLNCCLTHEAAALEDSIDDNNDESPRLRPKDLVWLVEAVCCVARGGNGSASSEAASITGTGGAGVEALSSLSPRLISLASRDQLDLNLLASLTRSFVSNAPAALDKEKDKSFVVEGTNDALWRALEASAARQFALALRSASGGKPSPDFEKVNRAVRLLEAFTTAGKTTVELLRAVKPVVLAALADPALAKHIPALHARLSMVTNVARACESVSLRDHELTGALTRAFKALLDEEQRAKGLQPQHSGAFLRLAYNLACLGEMRRDPVPFAQLVARHFPLDVVGRWGSKDASSDFKVKRVATQLVRVYAGLRAIARNDPRVAAALKMGPSASVEDRKAADQHAASIFIAADTSSPVVTSEMQKDVYRRLKALASRRAGHEDAWPMPLSEAITQFGFHADVLLTLKAGSRVLPQAAARQPTHELGKRVFDLTLGQLEEKRAAEGEVDDSLDPVVRLLRHPAVSGIAIELDGPDHLAMAGSADGSNDALARARTNKYLEALEAAAKKADGKMVAPSAITFLKGGGDGSGEQSLATSGDLLDAVLQVHGHSASHAGATALRSGGTAPPRAQATPELSKAYSAGVNLRTVYRKWLLEQYGWIPLSLSHVDYDARIKYADAASAEAFLEELLHRHAQRALKRLNLA